MANSGTRPAERTAAAASAPVEDSRIQAVDFPDDSAGDSDMDKDILVGRAGHTAEAVRDMAGPAGHIAVQVAGIAERTAEAVAHTAALADRNAPVGPVVFGQVVVGGPVVAERIAAADRRTLAAAPSRGAAGCQLVARPAGKQVVRPRLVREAPLLTVQAESVAGFQERSVDLPWVIVLPYKSGNGHTRRPLLRIRVPV